MYIIIPLILVFLLIAFCIGYFYGFKEFFFRLRWYGILNMRNSEELITQLLKKPTEHNGYDSINLKEARKQWRF